MFIFVDSKALKWAHNWLATISVTQSIGKNRPVEIRIRDCAKHNTWVCASSVKQEHAQDIKNKRIAAQTPAIASLGNLP